MSESAATRPLHGSTWPDEPPSRRRHVATPFGRPGGGGLPLSVAALVLGVLAALLGFAVVAMPLAMLGSFEPFVTGVGAVLVTAGLLAVWTRSLGGLRSVAHDRTWQGRAAAVVVLAVIGGITVLNVAFRSEHLLVSRDPGVYTVTGALLAEEGTLVFDGLTGPFTGAPALKVDGAGFYRTPDSSHLHAGFFHLLPAVLAAGAWAGGPEALVATNAILGAAALLAVYAFATRLVHPWLATAAAAALALNLVQAYFSRDTFTEILSQAFVFGGLWAYSLAREHGGPVAGAAAGATFGAACMARIDAFFFLLPLVAFCAWEVTSARLGTASDRRRRLLVVMGVLLGAAGTAALGYVDGRYFSGAYFGNLSGQFRAILVGLAVTAGIGALVVVVVPPVWRRRERWRRGPLWLAAAAAVVVVLAGAYAWWVRPVVETAVRPGWVETLGRTTAGIQEREGLPVNAARTYAEDTFARLALYCGPAAVGAAILGTAVAVARVIRGRGAALVPFLAVFVATTALYTWRPSITPDMVWAMRRYLPVVIPGIALSAAYALHVVVTAVPRGWRIATWSARGLAAVAVIALVGYPGSVLSERYDVRAVSTSLAAVDDLCEALPPGAAVLLLHDERIRLTLPQTLQAFCDVPVAVAPGDVEMREVQRLATRWRFAGRALHLVTQRSEPLGLAGAREVRLPVSRLETTLERLPREMIQDDVTVFVTRVSR